MPRAGAPARQEPLPIRVRLARPEDREAVMRFATRTWDGYDYIPSAWPGWIEATDGVLLVATPAPEAGPDGHGVPLVPDRPIAMTRVCLLAEGEGWLEGIRVDPRVRGRGVATTVQVAELAWAAAHGARVVRYTTDETNEGSHRLGLKHGFRIVAERRMAFFRRPDEVWRAETRRRAERTPAQARDALAAERTERDRLLAHLATAGLVLDDDAEHGCGWWQRLQLDPEFRRLRGFYERRPWTLQPIHADLFAAHLAAGEVVTIERAGTWAMAVVPRPETMSEDSNAHLALVAGEPALIVELAQRLAHFTGALPRLWPASDSPLASGERPLLATAGYELDADAMHLLERPLDAEHPPPEPDGPNLLQFVDVPRRLARPPPGSGKLHHKT